jgi:hypothetical protein
MADSLKQACIDERLNNNMQGRARARLRERLATENLTAQQIKTFTTVLEMSEAGIIYAVSYNTEADDYVWSLIEDSDKAFEAAYGRPPMKEAHNA